MKEKINDLLKIPEKLLIGFNERKGTFTGRLSYVTYYRGKEIAKKTSWEGWRDEKIAPLEIDNVPTSGFELNKTVVGGEKTGWNQRQEYCRVYDPRGFEFEITFANLLFILQETGYTPEEGLIGEFVYSWDRADLVLLPVESEDYKASKKLKEDSDTENIKAKDLVLGKAYKTKNWPEAYYIGKLKWKMLKGGYGRRETKISDYHSFLVKRNNWDGRVFDCVVGINGMDNILLTLDLPQMSISDVEMAVSRFKETVAGNLGNPEEIKLIEAPDDVKKTYEDILDKKLVGRISAGKQLGPKMIMIYSIECDTEPSWITRKQTGLSLYYSKDRYFEIKDDKYDYKVINLEAHKVDTRDNLPEDLSPIKYGAVLDDVMVRVGDIWYPGGTFLIGVFKPEIDL